MKIRIRHHNNSLIPFQNSELWNVKKTQQKGCLGNQRKCCWIKKSNISVKCIACNITVGMLENMSAFLSFLFLQRENLFFYISYLAIKMDDGLDQFALVQPSSVNSSAVEKTSVKSIKGMLYFQFCGNYLCRRKPILLMFHDIDHGYIFDCKLAKAILEMNVHCHPPKVRIELKTNLKLCFRKYGELKI